VKNGIDLYYEYLNTTFSRDDGSLPSDDFYGHATNMTYNHRFTEYTTGSIYYGFTSRRFDGNTEDYDIHNGSLGLDHAFTRDVSINLAGGYFIQKNMKSEDLTGYTYSGTLSEQSERGSFTLGGSAGWREAYQDVERRGFIRYWSLNIGTEYAAVESLNVYANGSYTHNRDSVNREWETWEGNCGLRWVFARWFSLSLDYAHREVMDDIDTAEYEDNRIMLIISASRLFRW
jgi:hypothetical protein